MTVIASTIREWFTAAELLELRAPALPDTIRGLNLLIERQAWRADERRARVRFGQGGGWEYHYSLFPAEVQVAILAASAPVTPAPASRSSSLWADYERLGEKAKAEASRRLGAVDKVETLARGGMTRQLAVAMVAGEIGCATRTLWTWVSAAGEVARADRLPALAPRHAGRTAIADCDPRAWDAIVTDYLRLEGPCFEACWDRIKELADREGWAFPSQKTMKRRIDAEFPAEVQILMRKGEKALADAYPAQRRDRSCFHALEAVNIDGHTWDVFVRWEDGEISRPTIAAFQDLFSGTCLSHRIDKSENKVMVRLTIADLVTDWGIPRLVWLDNGRAFASKWISGQFKTRYRFKIRDDEPEGILKSLGVEEVRWTKPYSGRSKPIERMWKDFCERIAKHPACAGAYTGNSPMAKPENYGNAAIPIAEFRALVASEIAKHNAKVGRKSATCKGRSFLETLSESLAQPGVMVRRATPEQRRMFLLAAEAVKVRGPSGVIELMGARYWAQELIGHIGEKVIVRFDPQALAAGATVYTLDNRLICEAEALGDVAFDDADAARADAKKKADFQKAAKAYAAAERRMSIDDLAAMLPKAQAPVPESPRVVQIPSFGRRGHAAAAADMLEGDGFTAGLAALEGGVLAFRQRNSDGAS